MPGLKKPEYTQFPNEVLDAIDTMKESEIRVMLVLCRYTFGFHRDMWKATLRTLMKKTGMSKQGVLNGVAGLTERGWIEQNRNGVSEWSILFEVNLVDQEGQPSRPPSKKETIERNTTRVNANENITSLENSFIKVTRIPIPENWPVRTKLWRTPLKNMHKMAGDRTEALITEAVKKMRQDRLTIASPKSIEKVFTDLYARSQTEAVQEYMPNADDL